MDDDPTTPRTRATSTAPEPAVATEPARRRRPAPILTTAPALAITALAAVPLAAALRVSTGLGTSHTAAILADECDVAFIATAINTMKWPLCAGD